MTSMGEGSSPTRATSTRGSTSRRSTSCRSSSSWRTTATPSACRRRWRSSVANVADRASGYGIPGVVVDGADVLACYAAARDRGRAGTRGRGPHAHRGQGDPAHRALLGRPADQVPLRGGARVRARARRPATVPSTSSRDAGVLTEEIEARAGRRHQGDRRGRHRLRRGRARPGSRDGDALRLRRRHRGRGLMPARTFIDAIRETLVRRDAPRPVDHRARRGRRQEGRGLPRDGRAVGGVRRRARHRYAADGIDDRRHLDRRRRQRPAAGVRDPVRRLHLPGVQPDRVRGGADALSLQQRLRRAR